MNKKTGADARFRDRLSEAPAGMTTAWINRAMRDLLTSDDALRRNDCAAFVRALASCGVTAGGKAVRGLFLPKIFSEKAERILKHAGETFAAIGEKAIRFFWEDEEFRSLFGFDGELAEAVRIVPPYETLLPMLRVDVFYDEESGDYQLCELNTDGTSGMIEDAELVRAFSGTETFSRIGEAGCVSGYELFDSLARTYLGIYRSADPPAGTDAERPLCAVVDFLECASSLDEFGRYRESFERLGAEAVVADVRDLAFDGTALRLKDGRMVDLIYRRAVTSDLFSRTEEARDLLAAHRAGAVFLMGGICTQIVHDKAFLPAVLSKRAEAFLTAEERAFLREHVPETAILTEDAVRRYALRATKDRWVLKPRSSYGSRGVYIGRETAAAEWEAALKTLSGGTYLLQEFVEPYRSWNIDPESGDSGEFGNTTGIYVFGERYAGLYSRASAHTVITTARGGYDLGSAVFRPKRS